MPRLRSAALRLDRRWRDDWLSYLSARGWRRAWFLKLWWSRPSGATITAVGGAAGRLRDYYR
jgi:hypothetical protein